jgi:hypothetical protein
MLKLTWPQTAAWSIRRHHLYHRAPAGSMLAVATRLCGLHAQVMSSAELTVWARVENLDRHAVQRALWEDRTLAKTWAMRGPLHLLPADELPLWHVEPGLEELTSQTITHRFRNLLYDSRIVQNFVPLALDRNH